ncbi:serine hydrolase domain-containing protein [Agrococcus casei]|uniref:serine hydrolase domain-containing protein n=1 Tax=Agrococcus casei TaxID=343512 RepID=UPI003F8E4B03
MTRASDTLATIVRQIDDERLAAYGVVVQIGDDRAEHRWLSDDRVDIYSASKGVATLAAGIAVDEGILTPSTRVAECLPEFAAGQGAADVTLEQLLRLSSGIDFDWFGLAEPEGRDVARDMLALPVTRPGKFLYTNASHYTAMRMLASRVGDVRDYLMPRLFLPLGILNPQWQRCPLGHILAGTGLMMTTAELARVGQLLRDRGRWEDRQLVSSAWVDAMHESWLSTGGDGAFAEYGMGAWNGPEQTWRLDGLYGQYVVIDQQRDAVATITAHEEERDHLLAEIAARSLTEAGIAPA